ncbi:hypothetical protein PBRA_000188, partial [Plasmodiophora brassicae]
LSSAAGRVPGDPAVPELPQRCMDDFQEIMSVLGPLVGGPRTASSMRDVEVTRDAVIQYLLKSVAKKDDGTQEMHLSRAQADEANRKVAQWTDKYRVERDLRRSLEEAKMTKRKAELSASADGGEQWMLEKDQYDRSVQHINEQFEKSVSVLPDIAKAFVTNRVDWEQEFARLDREVHQALLKANAERFTELYLKRDPMRKVYEETVREKPELAEAVPVRLSTLLSMLDPRFEQKLRDTGIVLKGKTVDMAQPLKVMKTLTDLGYNLQLADINEFDRPQLPYEAEERERLIRGVNPDGSPMTEDQKWHAILKEPEIKAPVLDQKRTMTEFWARRMKFQGKLPADPYENPTILPEELQPRVSDLDPDKKPAELVSPDLIIFDACPLCNKPKTGPGSRARCWVKPEQANTISHTNIELLNSFVTELGMIMPARKTGMCAKYQRKITRAIKRARQLGLMPYISKLQFGKEIEGRTDFDMYNVARRQGLLTGDDKADRQEEETAAMAELMQEPEVVGSADFEVEEVDA